MPEESLLKNNFHHDDCRNYCIVDVVKGICRRTQEMQPGAGNACSEFALLPKCKFCSHYSAGEQTGLGFCLAEASQPWVAPGLIAVTCEMFEPALAALSR